MTRDVVVTVHDAGGKLRQFLAAFATACAGSGGSSGRFVLALGSTMTSDMPGISAAGATPRLRRLTPRTDAEALVLGRTADGHELPVSPAGIVSPVVITRAVTVSMSLPVAVVDCGSFEPPRIPCLTVGREVAGCVSSGRALEPRTVETLFQSGLALGQQLSLRDSFLIVSECTPGGTTTALGVLTALGYDAQRLMSSSLPQGDHELKAKVVRQGLERAGLSPGAAADRPFLAVAAAGDPMQPFTAGLALSASRRIPVMLAGGSQMLCVWALMRAIAAKESLGMSCGAVGVVTTGWVAFDRSARCPELARLVDAPMAAACPDFNRSRHPGLRAYEQGHVKEGVGAGGAMAAAVLSNTLDARGLMEAIDDMYDELVTVRTAECAVPWNGRPAT